MAFPPEPSSPMPTTLRRAAVACAVLLALWVAALGRPATLPAVRAAPPHAAPVVAAVGDIACDSVPGSSPSNCQYDDVATLAERIDPEALLLLGDTQYDSGLLSEFRTYYDRYFGGMLRRTYPVPGNHEYRISPSAAGFFDYFHTRTDPPGYYSFDIGGWHLIGLNSQSCIRVGCQPDSAQYQWLKADLDAHPNSADRCTLAYWHHPTFASATVDRAGYRQNDAVRPLHALLDTRGADIVLAGHMHSYQRWAPADASGQPSANGVRQFVVGTGGRSLYDVGTTSLSTLVRAQDRAFGLLALTLRDGSYDFRWHSAPGQPAFTDAASGIPCR